MECGGDDSDGETADRSIEGESGKGRCRQVSSWRERGRVRQQKRLPEVADLGRGQTEAKTRNCGPGEHDNGRFLKLIIMMSPVVAPA